MSKFIIDYPLQNLDLCPPLKKPEKGFVDITKIIQFSEIDGKLKDEGVIFKAYYSCKNSSYLVPQSTVQRECDPHYNWRAKGIRTIRNEWSGKDPQCKGKQDASSKPFYE